jgi:hypothetical protein
MAQKRGRGKNFSARPFFAYPLEVRADARAPNRRFFLRVRILPRLLEML